MSETTLRKYLAGLLKTGHLSQIESHATAVGIADTNVHLDGRDSWIELKFAKNAPRFKIRPAQRTWFIRRSRAGATNLWLLWRYELEGQLHHGIIHMVGDNIIEAYDNPTPSKWASLSTATWGREIDPQQLKTILELAHAR